MVEEKKSIENQLENERKEKEVEIKEILKQQEKLLVEKEAILNKLSKTQQKILDIKQRAQKDNLKRNEKNSLPPKPQPAAQKQIEEKSDVSKKGSNDMFNPYKSSTPKNLSPRSLSPITTQQQLNSIKNVTESVEMKKENEIYVNQSGGDDDTKKYELIKQRMELAEEQKQLKELLENQERLLKEKQNEIQLQQKLHNERLEELNRLKCESQYSGLSSNSDPSINSNKMFAHPTVIGDQFAYQQQFLQLQMMQNQANYCASSPQIDQIQTLLEEQKFANSQQQSKIVPTIPYQQQHILPGFSQFQMQSINNSGLSEQQLVSGDQNLECLASLVYQKLLMKKTLREQSKAKAKSSKKSVGDVQFQENDDFLIRVINQGNQKKSDVSKDLSSANETDEYNENEESKLIEDLFFINKS